MGLVCWSTFPFGCFNHNKARDDRNDSNSQSLISSLSSSTGRTSSISTSLSSTSLSLSTSVTSTSSSTSISSSSLTSETSTSSSKSSAETSSTTSTASTTTQTPPTRTTSRDRSTELRTLSTARAQSTELRTFSTATTSFSTDLSAPDNTETSSPDRTTKIAVTKTAPSLFTVPAVAATSHNIAIVDTIIFSPPAGITANVQEQPKIASTSSTLSSAAETTISSLADNVPSSLGAPSSFATPFTSSATTSELASSLVANPAVTPSAAPSSLLSSAASKPPAGAIAGGVLGGCALLAATALSLFIRQKRRRHRTLSTDLDLEKSHRGSGFSSFVRMNPLATTWVRLSPASDPEKAAGAPSSGGIKILEKAFFWKRSPSGNPVDDPKAPIFSWKARNLVERMHFRSNSAPSDPESSPAGGIDLLGRTNFLNPQQVDSPPPQYRPSSFQMAKNAFSTSGIGPALQRNLGRAIAVFRPKPKRAPLPFSNVTPEINDLPEPPVTGRDLESHLSGSDYSFVAESVPPVKSPGAQSFSSLDSRWEPIARNYRERSGIYFLPSTLDVESDPLPHRRAEI